MLRDTWMLRYPAHLNAKRDLAVKLIRLADMPPIREWTESTWGSKSPYVQYREIPGAPRILSKGERESVRTPTTANGKYYTNEMVFIAGSAAFLLFVSTAVRSGQFLSLGLASRYQDLPLRCYA